MIGNCFYADLKLDPLDTSPPEVRANTLDRDPLEDDDTLRSSKTWSWTCLDDVSSNCTYRYKIDTAPLTGTSCVSHTFNTEPYGNVFRPQLVLKIPLMRG